MRLITYNALSGWVRRKSLVMYMKNKTIKKIQFGGWTRRRYKEIRKVVKKTIEKEERINLR